MPDTPSNDGSSNQDEQLALPGMENSTPSPQRRRRRPEPTGLDIERTDTRQALSRSLHQKGANEEGQALATGSIYVTGFGKRTKDFYAHFGLTPGNRAQLPPEVLRFLICYEVAAKRRVDRHIVQAQDQRSINRELANQCRIATLIIKRALYWAECLGSLEAAEALLPEPPDNYPLR